VDTDQEPEVEHEPSAELLYRWTIRGLYLVAFAVNFYMVWDAYKDTIEVKILTQRAKDQWRRLTRPVRESEEFRKMANWVHWEAMTIVEEAASGDTAAGSG
jgi:hypothetical protein